ncbi:E3 ubiquitin-protein ligase RNF213-like [Glandiceps talaboti]
MDRHQGNIDDVRGRDAENALESYFPRWIGFRVFDGEPMKASKALQDVFDLVDSVTQRRVILSRLVSKLDSLIQARQEPSPKCQTKAISNIIYVVAIAILLKKYKIQMKRKQLYYELVRTMFLEVESRQDWSNITCAIKEDFDTETIRRQARSAIVNICNIIIDGEYTNGYWMYCLPVLQLFDENPVCLTNTENITDLGWWGLSGIRAAKYTAQLQNDQDEKGIYTEILKQLPGYFGVDEMIIRSIAFLTPPNSKEMEALAADQHVPEYIITARLMYDIEKGQMKKLENTCTRVISLLNHRISQTALKSIADRKPDADFIRLMSTEFLMALRLLKIVDAGKFQMTTNQVLNLKEYYVSHIYLAKQATLAQQPFVTEDESPIDVEREVVEGSWLLSGLLCTTLKDEMPSGKKLLNRELEGWSKILNITYSQDSDELWSVWTKMIMVRFKERLTTKKQSEGKQKHSVSTKTLMEIYLVSESMTVNPLIHETMEDAVSDCLKGCESDIEKDIFSLETSGKRYAKLLSKLICRDWPQGTSYLPIIKQLDILIAVKLWPRYLDGQHKQHLPDEGKARLDEAANALKKVYDLLVSGMVSIELLVKIINNQNIFETLMRSIKKEIYSRVLVIRKREHVYLEQFKRSLSYIRDFSESLSPQVDTAVLTKAIALIDNDQTTLGTLCQISPITLDDVDINKPTINPEIVPKEVKQLIVDMPQDIISKRVFIRQWDKWKESRRKTSYHQKVMFEVVAMLWPAVKESLASLVNQIHTHSMTLNDIRYYFTKLPNGSIRDTCDVFLADRGGLTPDVDSFLEIVGSYLRFQEVEKSAKLVLECKDVLHLQGDFQLVYNLLNLIHKEDDPMSSVTQDLIDCSNILRDFDGERYDCLSALLDCKETIDWCKEVMKDASQVRAYTSLLLREVEESDVDMDKVAMFQGAITGYCPLVIELAVESNWNQFFDACKAVWTSLDSDGELSNKLINSQEQVQWLRRLVDVHSPSEVKCFHQMEIINHGGLYHITNPDDDGATLDKYVTLEVTSDEMDAESIPRQWSLSQLKDLRSKLMLVAGKEDSEKSNLKTYIGMLEQITRLANNFATLRANGDLYFSDSKVDIFCKRNPSTKYNVRIQVGKEDPITSQADPLDILQELAEFTEGCIREWRDVVSNARDKYHVLNNFNVRQVNTLRKQLTKLLPQSTSLTERNVAVTSLELLNLVVFDDENTIAKLPDIIENCLENIEENVALPLCEGDIDLTAFTNFLRQMKEIDGVTDNIARAAFQACNGDVEQGELWCIDHPTEDDDDVSEMYDAFKESEYADISDVKSKTALADAVRRTKKRGSREARQTRRKGRGHATNLLESVLVRQLEEHWISYQVDQTMMTKDNVSHLSLEFLAVVLEKLVDMQDQGGKHEKADSSINSCEKVEKGKLCIFRVKHDYHVAIICSEGRDKWIATSFDDESVDVRTLDCLNDVHLGELLRKFLQRREKRLKSSPVKDSDSFCIRTIASSLPGNGKSLLVTGLHEKLVKEGKAQETLMKIPVHTQTVYCRDIASRLIESLNGGDKRTNIPRIYHIDISPSLSQTGQDRSLLEILPTVVCLSPFEALEHMKGNSPEREKVSQFDGTGTEISELDSEAFSRRPFQHVYFYLRNFKEISSHVEPVGIQNVDTTFIHKLKHIFTRDPKVPKQRESSKCYKTISNKKDCTSCLELILKYIGIQDPTWAVLHHFVSFFDYQLCQWEKSPFCDDSLSDDLPDLRIFVLKFILIIAQDFATPSLDISDRSFEKDDLVKDLMDICKTRRRWENSPHPYVFFNEDGSSLTFHGFLVREDGSLASTVDMKSTVSDIRLGYRLKEALLINGVELSLNFDHLERYEQLQRMERVLNLRCAKDPDPSYELTSDCVTKMIAILMRFRCGVPVVIMGETGCGKTRLIRYLCEMMKGEDGPSNFFLMKVHGGTTFNDIEKKVELAEEKALENGDDVYTILFFDEANTTEAVSLIKEVMLDRTVNGRPLKTTCLQFVAACNPYRKLPEQAINNLEAAGLGFRVNAVDTLEKLGNIPLRHLVYRVHQLPPSLLACVWDFGQLSLLLEETYIRSMVMHGMKNLNVKLTDDDKALLIKVLVASHKYMRNQMEECRFVTLRDIERVITVFTWLYTNYDLYSPAMDNKVSVNSGIPEEISGSHWLCFDEGYVESHVTDDSFKVKRCTILTAGICYHSSLKNRVGYRLCIAPCFSGSYKLNGDGEKYIEEEITRCQDVFLDCINLNPNIARNEALKENVFMIIVCLELRIPIFLVGKPGSSKSLAKTIVDNEMKGLASSSELLKNLKSVQMWSCQCSQHSTAENIIETFNLCANFQRKQQLDKKIGVVVLDEVGLAEDTPSMPLKTLHPLLENGCIEDTDTPAAWKKVGFIGMSNWALDPAKMNRGIFVVRDVPSILEIEKTAREIVSTDDMTQLIIPLSEAYLDLFKECSKEREYYGLRDFYGLIKQLSAVCNAQGRKPTWQELKHCVCRNFDGHQTLNAIDFFRRRCKGICSSPKEEEILQQKKLFDCKSFNLVLTNLKSVASSGETRYLMLMTKHSAAHDVIWHLKDDTGKPLLNAEKTLVIFGSQLKRDQGYTQVCRNIKRIKLCMETGQTVVLINAENLYESLYDTMNQYYFEYGKLRYVNLGLGTNRFNSRVSKDFRLIIIAERDIVMKNYPIPLINRLEKHYLMFDDLLTTSERKMVVEITSWVNSFSDFQHTGQASRSVMEYKYKPVNVFIGLGEDSIAMIVHQVSIRKGGQSEQEIREAVRATLLQCCTPDAVIRLSPLAGTTTEIREEYFIKQPHSSLIRFLDEHINSEPNKGDNKNSGILAQVTTHGKLLNVNRDLTDLPSFYQGIMDVVNLQQFTSEEEIREVLQDFYMNSDSGTKILVFQLAADTNNFRLIPFSRYLIQDEWRARPTCNRHVVLVLHFSRIGENVPLNIPISPWLSIHIDELRRPTVDAPQIERVAFKSPSGILLNEDDGDIDNTAILKMCVQSAVGKIENQHETEGSHQLSKEDIVSVLQDLLKPGFPSESKSFSKVVTKRLCGLLKQRENNLIGKGTRWAHNEVRSPSALIAGGTVRKTLILKLCNEIAPVLAELISYMNKNNGLQQLNTFKRGSKGHYSMWLSLFEDDTITPIYIDSLLDHSLSRKVPTPDVCNKMKTIVNWKFPFTWVVLEAINEVIHSAENLQCDDQSQRLGLRLWNILKNGSIGRTITDHLQNLDTDWDEILDTYLHDFIHIVYKSEDSNEYKLAAQLILKRARETLPSPPELTETPGENHRVNLVDIHLAYRNVKGRLDNFSRLLQTMPDVLGELNALEGIDEMDVDVIALDHCLEMLIPDESQLMKASYRKKWLNVLLPNIGAVAQQMCIQNVHDITSANSSGLINSCRIKWNAISMIRLFMEHLSPSDEDLTDNDVRYPFRFFQSLLKERKVSKIDHLKKVERLLKTCNNNIIKRLFREQTCLAGEHKLAKTLIIILGKPYCKDCFKAEPHKSSEIRESRDEAFERNIDELKVYQHRCSLFLLELVSTFYLKSEGIQTVDNGMIDKLFGYIAIESELYKPERSPVEICNDTSPVVRSIMLQLLLTCGKEKTEKCLQSHFNECLKLDLDMDNDPYGANASLVELVVLYSQCIEDSFVSRKGVYESLEEAWGRLEKYTEQLKASTEGRSLLVQDIQDVAIIRFGLCSLAKEIHEIYESGQIIKPDHSVLIGMTTAQSIINAPKSVHISSFLLKQICRRYSSDYLVKIKEDEALNWIIPPFLKEGKEVSNFDPFAVRGKYYSEVKQTIASIRNEQCMPNDIVAVTKRLMSTCGRGHVQVCLLLALFHQSVICFEEIERRLLMSKYFRDETKFSILWDSTDSSSFFKFLDGVLERDQPQDGFFLLPTQRISIDRWLTSLLVHFYAVMRVTVKGRPLEPLFLLMDSPAMLKDSYLPSMPDDDFLSLRRAFTEEAGCWYACPNGHPYYIGECGKAWVGGVCQCGAKIGGEMHKLRKDNTIARDEELPMTGHIIGKPEERKEEVPVSCRKVRPVSFAVLRFITHAAMFFGCIHHPKEVKDLIHLKGKSSLSSEEVVDFLSQHMKMDVQLLAKAIGRSEEEANLTLHLVLCSMMTPPCEQTDYNYDVTLNSKEDRSKWEHIFAHNIIGPAIENLEKKLEATTILMAEDAELETGLLSVALFEKDRPCKNIVQPVFLIPFLWRYQARPSLRHLKGILQGIQEQDNKVNYPVLSEFMKSEHKLCAVRYLPDIVELQILLKRLFHLRISKNDPNSKFDASSTIRTFLDQYGNRRLHRLVQSFSSAWKLLKRPMLEEGLTGLKVQECYFYSEQDPLDMPLSEILPTSVGTEVWSLSIGVVDALVTIQNQFLYAYANFKGFDLSTVSQVVKMTDVTEAHLIAYNAEEDIEPLVIAYCDYSLEMGRGTCLDYNFEGLERQIITKFVQGKSRVQRETIIFTYGDSICDKTVFKHLRLLIPQTDIPPQLENEIITEFRERLSLPDLHTSLRALDLAIVILNSSGGEPGQLIQEYLTEALRLQENDGILSEKARKTCKLTNILSLWNICEVEKTKQLIEGGLDPFEDIRPQFKDEIPKDVKKNLERRTLIQFDSTTMDRLLKLLYEFIILELKRGVHSDAVPQEPLSYRIESLFPEEDIPAIDEIPDGLLLQHVVDFWKSVNTQHCKYKKKPNYV